MRVPAFGPAVALIAGASVGVYGGAVPAVAWVCLGCALVAACGAYRWRATWLFLPATLLVFAAGGALLAGDARSRALDSPLRAVLDDEFGGFRIDSWGPEGAHPPVMARGVLLEDAAADPPGAAMPLRIVALRLRGSWVPASGNVMASVSGTAGAGALDAWRAGRTIEAPMTFRRPTRYVNRGVPDPERDLALRGTTLFAAVKSALLVDVVARASWRQEWAAAVRVLVRRAVARWVAPHGELSAAIVTAVLIGDRTGLPDEERERLQEAGVYHVLAISGGNVAILVGLVLVLCRVVGLTGRLATGLTMALLLVYAQVVVAGPSVFRAVVTAAAYLTAGLLDQRTPPWQAIAVAAALTVALDPLDVVDAGFLLTFAATAALLAAVARITLPAGMPRVLRWPAAAVAASLATELVLLPIGAAQFGLVTCAGLLLNLAAIPLMTLVQIGGLALAGGAVADILGAGAGWVAHLAATGLMRSARLVDVLPWLAVRVPPPSVMTMVLYYAAASLALLTRGRGRKAAVLVMSAAGLLIVTGRSITTLVLPQPSAAALRLTMFDVGQGEAIHLQWPGGGSMLVDTGGAPFGGGSFDVGGRVLRPALWAAGVRRIPQLLITHGDPDHIGGARTLLESFAPVSLLEGIPVPGHMPFALLRQASIHAGVAVRQLRAGDAWQAGGAEVRVLGPERPDWERRRVRNDDSVVLEVRYGEVALLLTGDIGAEVESQLVANGFGHRAGPLPAMRILKVAHHGSRTSTSQRLVDAWQPQIALISCGRGNRFGHPAPEVIDRLARAGARVYRTDLHGAVMLTTDGHAVSVTTMRTPP